MRSIRRRSFAMAILVIGASMLAANPVDAQQRGQQGVRVSEGKPPDRNHNGVTDYDDDGCPPLVNGAKATPDPALGDKHVSDDVRFPDSANLLDYFMGEWKFVQGSKDLIVQKWCINRPPDMVAMVFRDHYTFRILTSENGDNTERIKADDEET